MDFTLQSLALAGALLAGMLAALEAGRRLGRRHLAKHPEAAMAGLGAMEGAVFALLGLVVAFTFSGAAARFDSRRQLIAQEANAIGTAYLRLDLLAPEDRGPLQAAFRGYLDARLDQTREVPGTAAATAAEGKALRLQRAIWERAVAALPRAPLPSAPMLVVPALNELIDLAATRGAASRLHPPQVVYAMLGVLALAGALLAGFASAGTPVRSWLHELGFALIFAVTVFVIVDLEHPRRGLIRIDAADQPLLDLRAQMR